MRPLYLARVGDLEQGDIVKIDCAACHHVALMTPAALLKLGLSPAAKVLDLTLGSDAAVVERGGEPRFRSSGTTRMGEWDALCNPDPLSRV